MLTIDQYLEHLSILATKITAEQSQAYPQHQTHYPKTQACSRSNPKITRNQCLQYRILKLQVPTQTQVINKTFQYQHNQFQPKFVQEWPKIKLGII